MKVDGAKYFLPSSGDDYTQHGRVVLCTSQVVLFYVELTDSGLKQGHRSYGSFTIDFHTTVVAYAPK